MLPMIHECPDRDSLVPENATAKGEQCHQWIPSRGVGEERGRAVAWQKLTNDVCTAVSERHVKIFRPRSLSKVRRRDSRTRRQYPGRKWFS